MYSFFKFLITFLLCIAAERTIAQDIIIMKSGKEVEAKIDEVGVSEIKYKKWTNQDGPTMVILKSDVFMIKYRNGEKEVMKENDKTENTVPKEVKTIIEKYHGKNKEVLNVNVETKTTKKSATKMYKDIEPNKKSASGASIISTGEDITIEDAKVIFGDDYGAFKKQVGRWRSGAALIGSGSACFVLGSMLVPIGIAHFSVSNDPYNAENLYGERVKEGKILISIGLLTLGTSFALLPVGIVNVSRGKRNANNIIEGLGQEQEVANIAPMELKYGGIGNGVGIALKF